MGYDALLLVSFGGPEGPEDVLPFLEHVTRGRGVPRARLAEVGKHYHRFGGVSPINQQCRDLKAAIENDLAEHGIGIPVYWGNRNWHPFVTEAVRQMTADGVTRAAAFVTSAYSGYSCCRQYRDDIDQARAQVGPDAPRIDKLRAYFNHPGFVRPVVENARAALSRLPADLRGEAHLIFTAHSVPVDQPGRSDYVAELTDISDYVQRELGVDHDWRLVYQSRSGPPNRPWLEPDVCDHLEELKQREVRAAVIVPIGFVSDHMEIKYDLDVEAADLAAKLDIRLERASTPGTRPRFVAMVRELLMERSAPSNGNGNGNGTIRPALGTLGPRPDVCAAGCCADRQ